MYEVLLARVADLVSEVVLMKIEDYGVWGNYKGSHSVVHQLFVMLIKGLVVDKFINCLNCSGERINTIVVVSSTKGLVSVDLVVDLSHLE